jgi:hypothetical protein
MKKILISLDIEEATHILDERLCAISSMFSEAYRGSENPVEALKLCKEAVQLYFQTENLLEKLVEVHNEQTP